MASSQNFDVLDSAQPRRKSWSCPHCQRQFQRHEHLERHVRIHTNEKPYKCFCGTAFSRRDLLKRHNQITHAIFTPETQAASSVTSGDHIGGQYHHCGSGSTSFDRNVVLAGQADVGDADFNAQVLDEQLLFPGFQFEGNPFLDAQDIQLLQNLSPFENVIGHSAPNTMLGISQPGPEIDETSTANMTMKHQTCNRDSSNVIPPPSTQSLNPLLIAKTPTGGLTLPVLNVMNEQRDRLCHAISRTRVAAHDLVLPSCHSMTRFLNAFFDSCCPHIPVFHVPTFRLDSQAPEVVLAMAALGAQCRLERRHATTLFNAAKAILHDSERHKVTQEVLPQRELMQQTQCVLLLITFAAWQSEPGFLRDAVNMQSFLARCVRELQPSTQIEPTESSDWETWVQHETVARTSVCAFIVLNLHSIALGTPPALLSDELSIALPSSSFAWSAPTAKEWPTAYTSMSSQRFELQAALLRLRNGWDISKDSDCQGNQSALGNHILLHALIQRITLVQQMVGSEFDQNQAMFNDQKEAIRLALHAWTCDWQRTPESSLDPRNSNGPISFTSAMFLGLAYVRLALNLGIQRLLESRTPEKIADKLLKIRHLPPGPDLLPAILHATHASNLMVELGVNHVAKNGTSFWDVQHSLCGFELAIFLSKWLFCIADGQKRRSLNAHENGLIKRIEVIVEEGRTSADQALWAKPAFKSNCVYLGFAVVKFWACILRGNEQWAITRLMGEGLDLYATMCKERYLSA